MFAARETTFGALFFLRCRPRCCPPGPPWKRVRVEVENPPPLPPPQVCVREAYTSTSSSGNSVKGARAAGVQSRVHVLKCGPRDGPYYPCLLHQQGPGARSWLVALCLPNRWKCAERERREREGREKWKKQQRREGGRGGRMDREG